MPKEKPKQKPTTPPTPPRPIGRPAIWTSPEVLQKLIDQYFQNQAKPTLAGLAFALDISRATLYNYEGKDEFLDTIKRARMRIELIYEEALMHAGQPTGVIFALKNMGWRDRAEVEHGTTKELDDALSRLAKILPD